MADSKTQRLFLTLMISVCSAWAEGEAPDKPACNCPQANGYNNAPNYGYSFPHYGYNIPKFGDNVPNPSTGEADKDNSKDNMYSYSPQGVFMAHPYMYMMPQLPLPHGGILKGEKGEPGISVKPLPQELKEADSESLLSQEVVERLTKEYLEKQIQGLKGDKGDRGITGPPGFKGEAGPPGPSGRPGTLTRLKPSIANWESQHERHSLADNIQGDDQFNRDSKVAGVKVAFTVALDKNVGPTSDPHVLKFNFVTTNLGEGYNTETGQFVAPAPGLYVFSYHILGQHTKPMEVALHHNDKTINSVHSRQTGGYTGVSNSAVLALEKGDIITLVLSPGIYSVYGESGHHTTFTGYLLYPD